MGTSTYSSSSNRGLSYPQIRYIHIAMRNPSSLNAHTDKSSSVRCIDNGRRFLLHSYFVYASSQDSGEPAYYHDSDEPAHYNGSGVPEHYHGSDEPVH